MRWGLVCTFWLGLLGSNLVPNQPDAVISTRKDGGSGPETGSGLRDPNLLLCPDAGLEKEVLEIANSKM